MKKDTVAIFDTTLRDGEQAGHKMSKETKIAIAGMLDECGVDVIEAGFPISSQGDKDSIIAITKRVESASVCALARARESDIVCAAEAIEQAKYPRIHTFIATSDIHVERKLRKKKDEVLEMVRTSVRQAKKYCDDVEFSPEDAARTSQEYLRDVIRVAISEGAFIINVPDTVGYAMPESYGGLISYLYSEIPELVDVTVSTHCHNDLGLATANSLAGGFCWSTTSRGLLSRYR